MNPQWLGRLVAPDTRDRQFLLSAPAIPPTRTFRAWYDNGWWGDQGPHPYCVGYAWAHFIEDSPRTHKEFGAFVNPELIYHGAQLVDEWDGTDYEGTSVRAGAKVLQQMGFIGEYRWAFDADTLARNVLESGPCVMGTDWYQSMFTPDHKGQLHIEGSVAGGHAYVINAFNRTKALFRIKNSWSREWGIKGHAWISFDDVARLLAGNGEACMAVEA